VVETFEVASADEIEPLGRLEMTLPRPEQLMSVRFDGPRAYAVTFERTDPLFVLDLSDPAAPEQRGELEIPGWLYHMEPRGDRLFAVGFEDTEDTSLQVSLFDVSDLDNPSMIDRVNFGAGWGWMVEDQDRIHKAFSILGDLGLILMPFAGWSYDDEGWYGSFNSGIQMIDFTRDSLDLKAVIPHHGFARRAFIHRDRLFAMSDERVESFDITDRDEPERLSQVILTRSVYRVAPFGNYVAELVSDWWTGEARLDILPQSDPDGMNPLGSLDLAELLEGREHSYYYWSYGFSYYNSRMLADGDQVYLLWQDRTCGYWWWDDGGCGEGEEETMGYAVFDVSNPREPEMVSHGTFPVRFPAQYGWWWMGTIEAGDTIVQVGSTVVIRPARDYWYWWDEEPESDAPTLEILDFSDPRRPQHAASFSLPEDQEMGTLQVVDDLVLTSHEEETGAVGRVRFYLDQISVENPERPRLVRSINIPGSPVHFDPHGDTLVTIDYQWRSVPADDWSECYGYWGDARYDEEESLCYRLERTLNLLEVERDRAVLLDRLAFEDRIIRDVRVTEDRVFIGTQPNYSYWWYDEGDGESVDPRPELIVVTGVARGVLRERGSIRMSSPYTWLYAARGSQAIVLSDTPPALDLYGSSDPDEPDLINQSLLTGYGYDVHLLDDAVISANSMWGVQVIPLP
jgi:hypothetical protein